jgi:hypothetical protein
MEYNKIIAVTGLPGLYELLSSKSDGAIVKSLDDKSTRFVSSRVHNFSHLETIEIFTIRENVNLVDVFNAMEKNGGNLPDEKDAKAIKAYFEKVYPDMDFERVYNSDMKKMIKWFGVLKANNVEIKLTEYEEEVVETPATEPVKEESKPAPKAKAVKKKEEVAEAAAEEAPKKKATRAKKEDAAAEEEAPKKKAAAKKK